MTYMLDTNICIYVMKNRPEKVLQRFREELDGGLCISSITLAELEYGMKHSSATPHRMSRPCCGFFGSAEHPSLWGGSRIGIRCLADLSAKQGNAHRALGYAHRRARLSRGPYPCDKQRP